MSNSYKVWLILKIYKFPIEIINNIKLNFKLELVKEESIKNRNKLYKKSSVYILKKF